MAPPGGGSERSVLLALSLMLFTTSCAAVSRLVPGAMDTHSLAGVWVDSTKATPADTIAWKLDPNGSDWTLEIRIVRDSAMRVTTERRETRYGYWYLQGVLTDTAGRALCIKVRPRDGATCYAFELDTLPAPQGGGPARRRMVVLGYQGQQHKRTRVLIERLP
jgi:hypothetical protein